MSMNDYTKALAAAREALAAYRRNSTRHYIDEALEDVLAALDAAQGEAVVWYRPSEEGYDSAFRDAATVARCDGHDWAGWVPLYAAPPAQPLVERYGDGDGVLVHWPEGVEQYVQVGDCVTGYLARPTQPVAVPADGWKEATIAWEVCASIHRKYAKGRDALFSTRQHDFVAGAEKARAMLAALAGNKENGNG